MSNRPAKGSSGEHPAVIAFREKMDSIQEHSVPACEELAARVGRLKGKSDPPAKDARREDDDEVPVDVVEIQEGKPWPQPKKK